MDIAMKDVLIQALAETRSPVTITDALAPDNPIIYCNKAFTELTGYPEEEIIGRNCRFLQGDGTDKTVVETLRTAIESHEASTVTLMNFTKNGEPFWNDLQVTPVRNGEGVVTHFFGFQANISERLEKEKAAALVTKLESEIHLAELEDKKIKTLKKQYKTDILALQTKIDELAETIVSPNKSEISLSQVTDLREMTRRIQEKAAR